MTSNENLRQNRMRNSIPDDQLTQRQLNRLAAQRYLYSKAKKLLLIQVILAVPVALAWSIGVALIPALKAYAALWGVCVLLLDKFVLESLQRSWIQRGAKIQELFDCDVLHLEWNTLTAGRRPDIESVTEAADRYKSKDPELSTLKNWYPIAMGRVPLHLARLICQRANCWWDAKLRRRYADGVVITLVVLVFMVFVIGLIGGWSLEKFMLAVVAPLSPAVAVGIREYRRNTEAARTADGFKEYTEDVWDRVKRNELSSQQLLYESRKLQDAIYNRRRNGPLIFDWVYRRLRNEQEEQMNKNADTLVAEAPDSETENE